MLGSIGLTLYIQWIHGYREAQKPNKDRLELFLLRVLYCSPSRHRFQRLNSLNNIYFILVQCENVLIFSLYFESANVTEISEVSLNSSSDIYSSLLLLVIFLSLSGNFENRSSFSFVYTTSAIPWLTGVE